MTLGLPGKNTNKPDQLSFSGYSQLFRKTLNRYLQRVPSIKMDNGVDIGMNNQAGNGKAGSNPGPARLIAFYLPQFHRIPENDAWWGTGFTEWTHVKKGTPLFAKHVQPKMPSELGYYDLLDSRVRERQADLARQAGIEGFCYWHYWFGQGKRLLEKPFQEMLESGKPDFPFCLGWANESWTGIWHGLEDKILIKQDYPGIEDYTAHFNCMEKAFRNKRYIRINGKLLFIVYKSWELPDPAEFTECWQQLAKDHGLPGFYFIGISDTPLPPEFGFDGFMTGQPNIPERTVFPTFPEILVHRMFNIHPRRYLRVRNPVGPEVYPYKSYVRHGMNASLREGEFPVVVPNWDNTPRVGRRGIVLQTSTPGLFSILLKKAVQLVKSRPKEEQIIFIKSWNEWAEGNYLEPDRHYGYAYLNATSRALGKI